LRRVLSDKKTGF